MSRYISIAAAGFALAELFCSPVWAASYATGCSQDKCFPVVCDNRGNGCTDSSGAPYRGNAHFPVAWQDSRYGRSTLDSGNRYGTSHLDANNTRWGGLGYDLKSDDDYYRQPEAGGRW